jgi:hypothetical protein
VTAIGLALLFFSASEWLPWVKSWKSRRIMAMSSVYLEESIKDSFLQFSLNKAHLAHLLNPEELKVKEHYLELLFQDNPTEAIMLRRDILITEDANSSAFLSALKEICTFYEEQQNHRPREQDVRKIGNEYALRLLNNKFWINQDSNIDHITRFYLLTGNLKMADQLVWEKIKNQNFSAETLFNAAKLASRKKSSEKLKLITENLYKIANKQGIVGVKAIRHLVLLQNLTPFSLSELNNWVNILSKNEKSEKIDFMRVYALLHQGTADLEEKKMILHKASLIFNMEDNREMGIFCRWLMELKAFEVVTEYLPLLKARLDQDLFIIRSNALLRIGHFNQLEDELDSSPIIHTRWLLTMEARIQSMSGNFADAEDTLDRLFAFLENDSLLLRSTANYFEQSGDMRSLFYFLHKIKRISTHKKYALSKLLQHGFRTETLEDLINWSEELFAMDEANKILGQHNLYFKLLEPDIKPSSTNLSMLLDQAIKMDSESDNFQSKINLALAHLRNDSPELALKALGNSNEWLSLEQQNPSWKWIIAKILEKNQIDRVSTTRENLFDFMSRAEKESLTAIF